jgi:hypothetical protein
VSNRYGRRSRDLDQTSGGPVAGKASGRNDSRFAALVTRYANHANGFDRVAIKMVNASIALRIPLIAIFFGKKRENHGRGDAEAD